MGDVEHALVANRLDPATLIIEVTETALMKDADSTVSRLNQLKQLGVKIAIDDFGTGYSSLAYLRQFPVDVLKIDRSFISSMDGSDDSHALIHTMVELGAPSACRRWPKGSRTNTSWRASATTTARAARASSSPSPSIPA